MKMTDLNLDVKQIIINKITEEFQAIRDLDPETYEGYRIIITNERQIMKKNPGKDRFIFIVVKFLEGSKDFGQQRQPFSLNALSEHNTIDVCQKLMMDFSETYNLMFEFTNAQYTLRQVMNTPVVGNAFGDVYQGYRSVFYISGSFLIGINSNPITGITVKDDEGLSEEIDFVSAQMTFDAQPDSQPFYGTNNFNKTVTKTATFSVGFTMYALDTDFYNKALDTAWNYAGSADINRRYTLEVTYKNGKTYSAPMKLISMSGVQELRDFPATNFVFVR